MKTPLLAAVAVVAVAALSACGSTARPDAATSAPLKADTPTAKAKPTPTQPAFDPTPKGTYRETCDYLLGDFSSYTMHGYRFTADAVLHNTGDVDVIDQVKAVWHLSGGGKVTKSKNLKVAHGKTKRVSFTVPASGDQIESYQDLDNSGIGTACNVTVAMIDTY